MPDHPAGDDAPQETTPERFGARAILVAMAAVTVAWGATLLVLDRLDDTPAWWPGIDPNDAEVIADADTLERAFASQASKIRQRTDETGADWRVAINQDSANAWLAVRLRDWALDGKAPWPDQLDSVRVGFDHERVALGIRMRHDEGATIAWLLFTPEVREDGSVWVRSHGARIGAMPVPDRWVIAQLEHHFPPDPDKPDAPTMRQVLSGEAPAAVEPVVHLPDGRDVRILALHAKGGKVELSMRTESAE